MKNFFLVLFALVLVLSSAAGVANELTKVFKYGKPLIIGKDTVIIDGKIQTVDPAVSGADPLEDAAINNAARATVRVTANTGAGKLNNTGSGVNISPDGVIITCAHVIDEAVSVRVTFFNGRSFPAEVKATDKEKDLAVLILNRSRENLPVIALGDSWEVWAGDGITILGYPFGDFTITPGTIERLGFPSQGKYNAPTLHIRATVLKGNSGGPVIDHNGDVVGIIAGSYETEDDSQTSRFGVAIAINEVKPLINQ